MNARSKPTESHRHPDIRLTLTLMSHTAWNVGRELTNPGEDEWMCMAWQFGRRTRTSDRTYQASPSPAAGEPRDTPSPDSV